MRCECAGNDAPERKRIIKNARDESAGYMPSDFISGVSE
jgi:hypothetical protein